jgi:CRP/FNR family cyclic AMP-dependent transcriptional regulator
MNEDRQRNVDFFQFLSDEERAEFAEAAELVVFAPGENLIEEKAEPSSLFVLTSGKVEVCKRIPGHDDRLLAVLDATNERTVVGERGLLTDSRTSATVRAKGEVEAVKIPRDKFRAMIREGRPAAYKLAYCISRTLAQRLRRLDEQVVETIRELDHRRETDLDAFRDKLMIEWSLL